MAYRLDIPQDVESHWSALPARERSGFTVRLHRVARALSTFPQGEPPEGSRVEDVLPAMYLLNEPGYWLLFEVDHAARSVRVVRVAPAP